MSLNISIGVGGTSLCRALACRRVLDKESPLLRLFDDIHSAHDEAEFWMIKRKCLNEMLLNGEVFPNDVSKYGETIIHVSAMFS